MKMIPMSALAHQVQTRPKGTAFVFHEEVWIYERVAIEAESLARGLAVRGAGGDLRRRPCQK
jgi:long-chain acyl-CoA synthetase